MENKRTYKIAHDFVATKESSFSSCSAFFFFDFIAAGCRKFFFSLFF